MNVGHRIFVVNGDDVERVSQKVFNAFRMGGEAALPQFAGMTITVAIAMYELKDRRPDRIFRIDCSKMQVMPDGSLDEAAYLRNFDLYINAPPRASKPIRKEENVVDAEGLFNQRKLNYLNPKLSGPAHKKILDHLFH